MKIITFLKDTFRHPATYILFLSLCASTFSTRWIADDFQACGSSPESEFESKYCLAGYEGKARFQNFDLTDTPTSLLRIIENPYLADRSDSIDAFPFGLPAIPWTRETYTLYGENYSTISALQPLFLIIDLLYLLLLSCITVYNWKHWKKSIKIVTGIILAYLYLPLFVVLFVVSWIQAITYP